ncbi:MAG: FAD-dependent oxidoreductase [Pseudomonadota bacterium]
MSAYDALFQPLPIRNLTIKNRFLSTSHSPAYAVHGEITDRYMRYEEEKARGGVGLCQFGGATTVGPECSIYYGQIDGHSDEVIPRYRKMAAGIHGHGAACTVQLTHGGRRERWDLVNWLPTFSASCTREIVHASFPVVMEDHDIRRVVRNFASAARRVRDGDVDGVEISCQAGTLIEQFWSPHLNFRSDGYGGSLENRMRLGLEVLEAVRAATDDGFIVGIRMPGDQMAKGGLSPDDCVEIARTYAASGLIDFISVVGGQASTYKDEAKIWPTMWVPSAAYLNLAKAVKAEVDLPIFHATRITDAATATHAVKEGYLDMVGMTRAFIADPHHVRKLKDGREAEIRPCVGAGYCVDRVITGHDALCMHNVATSREESLPQAITQAGGIPRTIVVVGGGPAGMEAARICAARGHNVVLFEASGELGGQLVLAARATWRRDLAGVASWMSRELERLGVEIRFSTLAGRDAVLAIAPDAVIIATGGLPSAGRFMGSELALTTWDILSRSVQPAREMIVFDENGAHGALSCAQFAAQQGARVELITPDRYAGRELGGTNVGAHMSELYGLGVTVSADSRITRLERSGNRLKAIMANTYGGGQSERIVDQVVGDYATIPNDDLYFTLKPLSRNLGEVDLDAMAQNAPQQIDTNPDGTFFLYRAGDAWTSRNVHAAMLDAMRLCKDL